MKSEMKLVEAQTAGSANSLSTLQKKHDVLTETLEEHVKKESLVRDGLKHAEEEYGRVGKELETYRGKLESAEKALEEMLTEDTRFPYFVISGKTDALQRDEYMKAFQTSEGFRIGLLSITAAGVGLTLTAAKVVVFTELLFGPNDHFQAEDRAHRLGQKSAVNIFYLIQPKTTDDINFGMIRKKDRESGIMLDGHATHLQSRRVAASSLLTADSTEPLEKTHISTIMKREKRSEER